MLIKKITKTLFILFVISSLLLTSCGDELEYELVDVDHEGLVCAVPGHFVAYAHDEADGYYASLNASYTVYAMTHSEVGEKFITYVGDYTAKSFSDYLVQLHSYNAQVNANEDGSRAFFTYLMTSTEDSTTYYNSNTVISTDDMIYVVVLTCMADKLDYYADMFIDCTEKIRFKSDTVAK